MKEVAAAALIALPPPLAPAAVRGRRRLRACRAARAGRRGPGRRCSALGGFVWLVPIARARRWSLWRDRGGSGAAAAARRRVRRIARACSSFPGVRGRRLLPPPRRRSPTRDRAGQPARPAQRAAGTRHLAGRRLPLRPDDIAADRRPDRARLVAALAGALVRLAAPRPGPWCSTGGAALGCLRGRRRRRLALGRRQGARHRLARPCCSLAMSRARRARGRGSSGCCDRPGRSSGGVLWSNALAYHDVSLAPYEPAARARADRRASSPARGRR